LIEDIGELNPYISLILGVIENARLDAFSDKSSSKVRKQAEQFFESESFEIYYSILLKWGYNIPPFTLAKKNILQLVKEGKRFSFSGVGFKDLDNIS